MTMPDAVDVAVAQLPELIALSAFTLCGAQRRFDEVTNASIPQLWSKLVGALPFEGQDKSWTTYGVIWNVDGADGWFDYMAGVKLVSEARAPDGFTTRTIPAARYAVFRITLNGGALQPQVKTAMGRIWGELVPQAGLKVAKGPKFELYDSQFEATRPGAVIDFYIPVQ